MRTPPSPSPQQLAVLNRVVREVTRSRSMSVEDAEDFRQTVTLRLVERNFDVFDRFSGRSSLATYLRVVVTRMLLDWQNHTYGKWRPTALATRLGPNAVALDRLIRRDRYNVEEAIATLRVRADAPDDWELRRIAEHLEQRRPARQRLAESLDDDPFVEFDDPLEACEAERQEARIHATLAAAVGRLPSDDRDLIAMRYQQKRSVQHVARMLDTDAKALYRRFDRLLHTLRRTLVAEGVTGPTTIDAH
jgi:RNA polymerase sigma factor (sigma-70 family)